METHSFDPTPKDIIDIQNADIFIYMGGHSESWVEKILETSNKLPKKVIFIRTSQNKCLFGYHNILTDSVLKTCG